MRRKDAFRKVRTICQRLDQADTTYFRPQRLYLYGSLLTDKPNPTDIDLVLVYQRTPAYLQYLNASGAVLQEIREAPGSYYGRFLADLRRGMKMIRLEPATDTLANWIHQDLLILDEELRLIWQPGRDWATELERVQTSPRPWPGPRPPDAEEQVEALVKQMPEEERRAKLGKALSELEEQ